MKIVCERIDCFGCSACMNACPKHCITMQLDEEGFFVPRIDECQCIDCGLCQRICQLAHEPVFNPVPDRALAAWSQDPRIRRGSSSGGVFKTLAGLVLRRGGAVNIVEFDKDMYLRHRIVERLPDLDAVRGSKYVQSLPGAIFSDIRDRLEGGQVVLFTSTPCQVAGLLAFLRKDYANLLTCDLVCHGVPSPEEFRKDVERKTKDAGCGRPQDCLFRDLEHWGFKSYIEGERAGVAFDYRTDAYYQRFLSGTNYRETCYHCGFAQTRRVADITIGDFWGIGKYALTTSRFAGGCSLVLVNSTKGRELMRSCSANLHTESYPLFACQDNAQLFHPSERPVERDWAFQEVGLVIERRNDVHLHPVVVRIARRAMRVLLVYAWRLIWWRCVRVFRTKKDEER